MTLKATVMCARILVDMDVDYAFPSSINNLNKFREVVPQYVPYE